MNFFYPEDIGKALREVCAKLGVSIDEPLQEEYQNGGHPILLSYEKIDEAKIKIPAIQKYLIGTQTYLNQPTNYFDIYRTTRHIIFIQLLNNALTTIIDRVDNYQDRLKKLCEAIDYDPFEAILYEVLVASNYALSAEVKKVSFLDEYSSQVPDIKVITSKKDEFYVESKKFDRSVDIVSEIRRSVNQKMRLTIEELMKMKQSAIIEIAFHKDPKLVSDEAIRSACIEVLSSKTIFINKNFTLNITPISYKKLDEFILYPSPKFYWERYNFMENSEWFGIINPMYARFAHHISVTDSKKPFASTWLDDIEWEVAVKWKVTDEELIWRQKRLGYSLIFKGLDQLQSMGYNSVLHVWFERVHSLGHRHGELMHFFNTLQHKARDIFAWLIFNETILEVSPKGRFDLIEHAHIIQGPRAIGKRPFVTNIFTRGTGKVGPFGIGRNLPHIDDL
jgi:hypothetical protein